MRETCGNLLRRKISLCGSHYTHDSNIPDNHNCDWSSCSIDRLNVCQLTFVDWNLRDWYSKLFWEWFYLVEWARNRNSGSEKATEAQKLLGTSEKPISMDVLCFVFERIVNRIIRIETAQKLWIVWIERVQNIESVNRILENWEGESLKSLFLEKEMFEVTSKWKVKSEKWFW